MSTPWESARTSQTVPPGGRASGTAARRGQGLGHRPSCRRCRCPATANTGLDRCSTVLTALTNSGWSAGWAAACQRAAPSGFLFFFFLLPSHIPPAVSAGARVWVRVRGPVLIFRKSILYGVFEKWAHGHTNHLPVCTFSGTWPLSTQPAPKHLLTPYTKPTQPTTPT